jgi:hypothetical protein
VIEMGNQPEFHRARRGTRCVTHEPRYADVIPPDSGFVLRCTHDLVLLVVSPVLTDPAHFQSSVIAHLLPRVIHFMVREHLTETCPCGFSSRRYLQVSMWSHRFLIVTSAALMTVAACTVGTDAVGQPVVNVGSVPGVEIAELDASSTRPVRR